MNAKAKNLFFIRNSPLKKICSLAFVAWLGMDSSASLAETTMVLRGNAEEFTFRPDQRLIDELMALRTGFYDQRINLEEVIVTGNFLESRPSISIRTSQPFTGLHPFNADIQGNRNPTGNLYLRTTGGQSSDFKQGEAYLAVRLTLSTRALSEAEEAGPRLLSVRANFRLRTSEDHARANNQAYVSVYCGFSRRLSHVNDGQAIYPKGNTTWEVYPQAQVVNFDFQDCRDDVYAYYVADAQDIEFISASWSITRPASAP
jgi:hypothetical protein